MSPIILYRNDVDWRAEEEAARKYFNCISSRMQVKPGDLVIPRFSALPFYKELEDDVKLAGGKLINTYRQHQYVADLRNWVEDLKDLTPETWYRLQDIPDDGPFILKGETNSKKYLWASHMYAANKRSAIEVESKLHADSLITYQNIYIRRYIPLKTYFIGIQGLPITHEFRFFIYKKRILSGGYYWSSHVEDLKEMGILPNPYDVPLGLLNEVMNRVYGKIDFYSVDVAQTKKGDWIIVELNSGEMSGLSENNPDILYKNLKEELIGPINYNSQNTYMGR